MENKINGNSPKSLNRTLTLFPLVFIGLSYMIPTAVFSPYGITAVITEGRVPAAYLMALIMISFTAYSYGKMIKVFPSAGSAYTYTQQTISPHFGFLVGWVVMMDYLFLPMLNVLASSIFLHAAFSFIPVWIWILAFTIPITITNLFGIQLNAKINTILIIFQVTFVVIFIGLSIQQIITQNIGAGTIFFMEPFHNSDLSFLPILTGASIVATSFLGFDAVTTFSEETVNPKKTVPKAIFLVALFGGTIFILVSYTLNLVYPDFTSFINPDVAGFEIVQSLGFTLLTSFFIAASAVGCIGGTLSAQASGARLLYAMGRDSVLPSKIFGKLHSKYKTPVFNILFIGLVCLGAFFIDLGIGFSLVNFGALFAFTFVNLSVIFHFYIKQKQRGIKGTILYLMIPLIGACLTSWIWLSLSKNALIFGGIWSFIGIVYLLILTKGFVKKPPQYHIDEKEISQ
ncbi:APC family permease [Pseudalkalibacillus decolorationis]|uniref:APC family permease n=1 Tax=Pseudalkalibacillus decolorationis TaxID=163879 RepID=UPI0021485A0D|nr:APC family permease [Pseudalkalibacillus decolorationis]